MRISGTSIDTFSVSIKTEFSIDTRLALRWVQTEDGNWHATDRGSSNDVYRTKVTFHFLKGSVEKVIDEIYANREANSNQFTMDYFSSNEKIFGADIDYSSGLTVTLLNSPKIKQAGWKYFTSDMEFQVVGTPSFDASYSATLPDFQYLERGYNSNIEQWTINRNEMYDRDFIYSDRKADTGVFEGVFNFSDEEMANLRKYYRTNRDSDVSITDIAGVDEMFGSVRGGSYPYTTKILDIQEQGMWGVSRWRCKITFAEVVSVN